MTTRLEVRSVLSSAECIALIAAVERQGFDEMGHRYPKGYRNNDRLVRDDAELAGWLWARLERSLPSLDGCRPTGLNPRFRFCRYRDGQSFVKHRDGAWAKSATEVTRLTVQVYLNGAEEFEGGLTRFTESGVEVRPEEGMAIVFDHRLWHEGTAVPEGTKYVMRTDVVYPVGTAPAQSLSAGEGALVEVERMVGHLGYVWQAIALSDGRIVSGARDGTVRVWPGGGVLKKCQSSVTAVAEVGGAVVSATRAEGVLALAALSDGRVLAARSDGCVEVDGRRLDLGGGWCWSAVELLPGRVAVGCEDGGVRVLDVASWSVSLLARAKAAARSVARLSSGGVLVGLGDGRLWVDGRVVAAHAGAVTGVLEVEPGLWATSSEDCTVGLWTGEGERLGTGHHEDFARSIARAGQDLVSASYDGTVRRWAIDIDRLRPYLRPRRFPR